MKSKQRLAILFGAIVALMTILAVAPVFGATGALRFPDSSDTTTVVSWARQGGTVMIEVADADLDTGTTQIIDMYMETAGGLCEAGEQFQITTLGESGAGQGWMITSTVTAPILDADASGAVTLADVTETSTDLAILSVDGGNGIITVQCTAEVADGTMVQLTYTAGAVNDTAAAGSTTGSVKITSDASPVSHAVVLEESGAQTGVFRGILSLTSSATATSTYECLTATGCATDNGGGTVDLGTRTTTLAAVAEGAFANGTWTVGDLQVSAADTVVFAFDDTGTAGVAVSRNTSITVETTDPTVANTSPAAGTATDNNLPTVSGEITDTDSLVASASLNVVFGFDFSATPNTTINDSDLLDVVDNDIDTISSGFSIEQRVATIDAAEQNQDHIIYWWIIGNDVAGNQFVSDATPTTAAGAADACDPDAWINAAYNADDGLNGVDVSVTGNVFGCQGFSISVDRTAPDLVSATTGVFWDSTLTGDDKTQTDVTKALATSISLVFDGALDADTVALTDFTVAGATPLDIATHAGAPTRVFLTVAAQDPASRPAIALVGAVKDLAGNDADSDTVTAEDGIAPTLTLSVSTAATPSATRPITNDKANIALSSDEKGTGVDIRVVKFGDDTTITSLETELTSLGGPTAWTAISDQAGDGLYNVRASARDLNNTLNVGTAGVTSTASVDLTLATVVAFELDTSIPAPVVLPSTASGTDDPDTIISINFASEGVEYGLTAGGVATTDPALVVTDFDTYGTVTITKAELDTVDILADLATADSIRYLYKASGLALGAHSLVISATDSAGNAVDFAAHTFSVTARASTSIALAPGWNMVSFPGDPTDASIDAVIGTVPVTVVMAYDPTNPAGWLIATRDDATQSFSGTLTTISSGLGYWVLTDTFESISTFIPRISGGADTGATPVMPPTIDLVKTWNLVPIVDVTGAQTSATTIDPADYFGSVTTISRVYWFNTLDGSWVTVNHAGGVNDGTDAETLRIGRAYWVFTTAVGTLTP